MEGALVETGPTHGKYQVQLAPVVDALRMKHMAAMVLLTSSFPETLQTHGTPIIVVLRFQLGIGLFGQMGFEVAEIILLPPDFSVSPSPGCGRCRTQRPAQRCR